MKMLKIVTLIAGLSITFCGYAQVQGIQNMSYGTVNSIQFNLPNSLTYDVLSGSPYIDPEFKPGKVMTMPVKWVDFPSLRYNTYIRTLEFKEESTIKTGSVKQIRAFEIEGKMYRSGFPAVEKQTLDTYYQVIYDAKIKILKFTFTVLEPVLKADDVKEGNKFETYNYYYLFKNDKMTRFLPNKKNVLKLVSSENSSKLGKLIEDNDLKFREDKDFETLGKFIDGL